MSRVRSDEKYMNTIKWPNEIKGPSKVVRSLASVTPDYTKARTLSSWLFLKYKMSYKAFRGKSKPRKDALRAEYLQDTAAFHANEIIKETV